MNLTNEWTVVFEATTTTYKTVRNEGIDYKVRLKCVEI